MDHDDINVELLAEMLQNKRRQTGLSLREAADQIGITAPTLQRLESRQTPTASTLLKLAEWLGLGVDDLRRVPKERQRRDVVQQFEVLLRADPDLDPEAATTIANVARQVYDGLKRKKTRGKR
jgi:transcriptional regulator with XRE-family HTH domain